MNVAHDALAGGNGARQFVFDGMSRFRLRNRRVYLRAAPLIAVYGVRTGMNRGAVVRINDVTRRAATVAIVAGMIVGSGQREQGIEQSSLLQSQKHGIRTQRCAEPAIAQLVIRQAGLVFRIRIPQVCTRTTAAFKHTKNISRLRNLPSAERLELWQDPLGAGQLLIRGRKHRDLLRLAVGRIAFAEAGVLVRIPAVVVKRRLPQHASVGHHAGAHRARFFGVTRAAGFRCDAQVARIYELDIFLVLFQPFGVGTHGIRRALPEHIGPWTRMRLHPRLLI